MSVLKNLLMKTIFCSQLILIGFSLPMLYCVGISYNTHGIKKEQTIIRTNKGKKTIKTIETVTMGKATAKRASIEKA